MCAVLRDDRGVTPGVRVVVCADEGSGFTLVELLVVLGIISLLMALLLPALGKVRRQGRTLVGIRNIREITTAANLFASDNDDAYPPSIATVGTDDSWNWQAPSMLTGYLKRTPRMHRSASAYLRTYIDDADVMFCPNAPLRYRYLQEAWDAGDNWDHPETLAVPDAVFGTYCLYWNYVGYLGKEKGLFRGPIGPTRGSRASSIVVTDYFGFDHWRSPLAYGSCEPLKHAAVTDGTALSSAFWSRPGSGARQELRDLQIKLHAGHVDGHVESYRPIETQPMYVIKRPETNEPYAPGVGPGAFYLPRTGLR